MKQEYAAENGGLADVPVGGGGGGDGDDGGGSNTPSYTPPPTPGMRLCFYVDMSALRVLCDLTTNTLRPFAPTQNDKQT